jgi:hypothetical protein
MSDKPMVSKYDLSLVSMLAAIIAGGLASLSLPIAIHVGLGAGSLLASLVLVEVLFRNPPTAPERSAAAPSAVVLVGWLGTILTML